MAATQAAAAAAASRNADSFITEDQVEEEVAHGLVGVPYHLAVVATRRSTAQRMMWDKTTTKASALASSDRSDKTCAVTHRASQTLAEDVAYMSVDLLKQGYTTI